MKQFICIFTFAALSSMGFAMEPSAEPLLDKIGFQITAKKWVATSSALLTVAVNATLKDTDLVKARRDILQQLDKIAQGDWRITEFERKQDESGLEKLAVVAQARVVQSSLPSVYQNAKAVSKPGLNYTVNAIEFKPSLEEVEKVKSLLRERLYQEVSDEINRMNQTYNHQRYSLYNLVFVEGSSVPQQKNYQNREMINTMSMPVAASPVSVSNELVMTAIAQAASNRKQEI